MTRSRYFLILFDFEELRFPQTVRHESMLTFIERSIFSYFWFNIIIGSMLFLRYGTFRESLYSGSKELQSKRFFLNFYWWIICLILSRSWLFCFELSHPSKFSCLTDVSFIKQWIKISSHCTWFEMRWRLLNFILWPYWIKIRIVFTRTNLCSII